MFGPAGKFYIYFTYGMHWMLDVVTGPENYPAAILIRGGRLKLGQTKFARSTHSEWVDLAGPARLTKFLRIDKKLNGKEATRKTGLWIEDRGTQVGKKQIKRTPRVGVAYAGPVWSKKRYRFILKGSVGKKNNPSCSGRVSKKLRTVYTRMALK